MNALKHGLRSRIRAQPYRIITSRLRALERYIYAVKRYLDFKDQMARKKISDHRTELLLEALERNIAFHTPPPDPPIINWDEYDAILNEADDKLDADAAKGIRTLPVVLGERAARLATIGMFTLQYLLTGAVVVSGYCSPLLLAVLFALPWYVRATRVYRQPRPAGPPPAYPPNIWPLWYAAFAFQHTRRFGSLFLLGLATDVLARAVGLL